MMKAVIIKEHGLAVLADVEERKPPPGFIKIKTVAVAINPTDCDHCAGVGRVGGTLGCDVSGVVEEVGEDCKSDVKKGDAVYGVCHTANNNPEYDGSFAEYAMCRDGHIAKKPEHVSFEEAATLGVGITSVGQALYMTLKLPLPGEEPIQGAPFLLISGGSTATGTLAIQFAKLSGLRVIATASPDSFELLKSRGAEAVFDYHDPECANLIKEYTKGELYYILDCIGTEASYGLIAKAVPEPISKPVHMVTLLPTDPWPRKDITPTSVLAYTTFGKPFTKFGIDFPAIPAHFEYGVMFWKLSQKLLEEGKIKPHPVAMRRGGLSGIPDGLTEFASGKIRAQKLVYTVADTGDVQTGQGTAVQVREFATKW